MRFAPTDEQQQLREVARAFLTETPAPEWDRVVEEHTGLVTERRGLGMIQGIAFADPNHAAAVSRAAFERGLIIETAGSQDQVVKVLPPLTIDEAALANGLDIIANAVSCVADRAHARRTSRPPAEVHA